jgi:hypothetical protein
VQVFKKISRALSIVLKYSISIDMYQLVAELYQLVADHVSFGSTGVSNGSGVSKSCINLCIKFRAIFEKSLLSIVILSIVLSIVIYRK